jgi:hypothetical protein
MLKGMADCWRICNVDFYNIITGSKSIITIRGKSGVKGGGCGNMMDCGSWRGRAWRGHETLFGHPGSNFEFVPAIGWFPLQQ